jgi:hypothetical protein
MDFSTLLDQARGWLTSAWTQFEAMLNGSPLVAGVGILLALGIGFSVGALIVASVFKMLSVWRRSSLAAKVKRDTEVGARILLVKGNGGRSQEGAGEPPQGLHVRRAVPHRALSGRTAWR